MTYTTSWPDTNVPIPNYLSNVRQKVIAQLSFAALILSKCACQNDQEEPLAVHRNPSAVLVRMDLNASKKELPRFPSPEFQFHKWNASRHHLYDPLCGLLFFPLWDPTWWSPGETDPSLKNCSRNGLHDTVSRCKGSLVQTKCSTSILHDASLS